MIDSAIVYLGLMAIMTVFVWLGYRSKQFRWFWVTLACISFGVVMGIRMNVGIDFPMYLRAYEQIKAGTFAFGFTRWEPGFQLLFYLCSSQYLHYSIPFGIIAFLQMFLLFYGLRNESRVWIFIPLAFFLTGYFITFNNIIRHMVAFSIFVCAIPYLADRKYWQYLICIVAAACFHKSALVLLPLPLVYMWVQQIYTRIWVQLLWVGIGLAFMNLDYVQNIFEAISFGMTLLGYGDYMYTSFAEFDDETKIGLGFFVMLAGNLILILFSRQMKAFYEKRAVAIMYDMYFFGYFVKLAFLRMFLLQRLNYYFISFEFIIAALTMYMFVRKKNWIMLGSLIALYLAVFFAKLNVEDDGSVLYHTFLE